MSCKYKNFQKLISVKDKKKELFVDEISETSLNFFFNEMIDKKKNILLNTNQKRNFGNFQKKKRKTC